MTLGESLQGALGMSTATGLWGCCPCGAGVHGVVVLDGMSRGAWWSHLCYTIILGLQGFWSWLLLLHAEPVSVSPAVLGTWGCQCCPVGVSLGNVGKGTGAAPGSCQVGYKSRSSINYSNWLSEATLAPTLPPRGSMSISNFDALRAGVSLFPTLPFVTCACACGDTAPTSHTHTWACASLQPQIM